MVILRQSLASANYDMTFVAGSLTVLSPPPPVNHPPVFSSSTYSFNTPENTPFPTLVGTVSATDPDNDPLVYFITAGSGDFTLGVVSGQFRVSGSAQLDYETT